MQRGRAADAVALFRLNADLLTSSRPAQAELSRGYEALHDNSNAIAYARRALETRRALIARQRRFRVE
jgi:hypothetical protein